MTRSERRPLAPKLQERLEASLAAGIIAEWRFRTLEAGEAAATAKLFRGLADPTRLRILLALVDGEQRVIDLVTALGNTVQSNVSAHLACLRGCGLVTSRPQGRQVFYGLARPELFELLRAAESLLAASGQQIQLCPNYQER